VSAKENKIAKVMREFKNGTLKSSTGRKVTSDKQAKAIAISEGNKVMRKKFNGGGGVKKKTPAKKTKKKGFWGTPYEDITGKKEPATASKGGAVKKKKKQGYNAKLDESLGSRNRKTKGKLGARRRESEGMEKKMGRRKFAAVKTMDKGRKKRKA
jgi:hypothetical protein